MTVKQKQLTHECLTLDTDGSERIHNEFADLKNMRIQRQTANCTDGSNPSCAHKMATDVAAKLNIDIKAASTKCTLIVMKELQNHFECIQNGETESSYFDCESRGSKLNALGQHTPFQIDLFTYNQASYTVEKNLMSNITNSHSLY